MSDCAFDIALNKVAKQSSDNNGTNYLEEAKYAVDGKENTLSKTLKLDDQWWQVDFGEVMHFDNITLMLAKNENSRKKLEKAKVLVSNSSDFQSQVLCHEFPGGLPKTYSFQCNENPTTARHLKIALTQKGTIVLWDVFVYGWHL